MPYREKDGWVVTVCYNEDFNYSSEDIFCETYKNAIRVKKEYENEYGIESVSIDESTEEVWVSEEEAFEMDLKKKEGPDLFRELKEEIEKLIGKQINKKDGNLLENKYLALMNEVERRLKYPYDFDDPFVDMNHKVAKR